MQFEWIPKRLPQMHESTGLPFKRMILAATVTGGASMILFTVFLFAGSLHLVQMGLSERAAFAWDGLLSLLFFVQHSGMLRKQFRSHLSKIVSPPYHGALFAIVSGMMLISLIVLWQSSTVSLYELRGFPRGLVRGTFFLAMMGFAWGGISLRAFDPFGRTPIMAHLRGEQLRPQPFVVRGPYRWVRHPLYFFTLLLIWSCPDMTADRLLFNCLWSVWIFAGTILEEADLSSDFGEAYRAYQHRVPMLIPRRRADMIE
jgi:methanethiol S-methyltransferase